MHSAVVLRQAGEGISVGHTSTSQIHATLALADEPITALGSRDTATTGRTDTEGLRARWRASRNEWGLHMLGLDRLAKRFKRSGRPAKGADRTVIGRSRANEPSLDVEEEYDRQTFLPRLLVLTILGAAALIEREQGEAGGHWVVLAIYGLTTTLLVLSSRATSPRSWWHWTATVADAGLVVYVIARHLSLGTPDLAFPASTGSLFPAFLLLIQTGLRLRRDLVAAFAGLVVTGWLAALALLVGTEACEAADGLTPLATRQVLGFLSFTFTASFVLYAAHRVRLASVAILHAQWDRMRLSRFLPERVAAQVIKDVNQINVDERHACLLAVDMRGFSTLARMRPSHELIASLLEFRRLVHDAVSCNGGIVDKYIGDGVLAVFLDGAPGQQAEAALGAALDIYHQIEVRKGHPDAVSGIRVVATLHRGHVLAGVFDDDRRAEFTVLGPAMNALSRMERRAKELDADLVVSKKFLRLLQGFTRARLHAQSVARRPGDEELPDLLIVQPIECRDRTS